DLHFHWSSCGNLRPTQAGELLFEFHVAATHTFWRVELRTHGKDIVEAQFLDPVDVRMARTFHQYMDLTRTPREMAIGWAEEERKAATRRSQPDFSRPGIDWPPTGSCPRSRVGAAASRGCPLRDLLPALTFHVLSGAGTLSEHFSQLFDAPLADSSWADRRARLPWAIFADLMQRVLRPQATRGHRDAFWRGWRVVALDGTHLSLT